MLNLSNKFYFCFVLGFFFFRTDCKHCPSWMKQVITVSVILYQLCPSRECYVSHSSSGDCCHLYTVETYIVWLPWSADIVISNAHTWALELQTLKCIFWVYRLNANTQTFGKCFVHGPLCLMSRTLFAICVRTHIHTSLYSHRDSHPGRQCTCAVYRLHTGSSAAEEVSVRVWWWWEGWASCWVGEESGDWAEESFATQHTHSVCSVW